MVNKTGNILLAWVKKIKDINDICITPEGNSIVSAAENISFIDVNGNVKWKHDEECCQCVDASSEYVFASVRVETRDEVEWHILVFNNDGKMQKRIMFPESSSGVYSLNAVGDYVAVGAFDYSLVFNASGKRIAEFSTGGINICKIYGDGLIIWAEDGFISLVDWNGKEIWATEEETIPDNAGDRNQLRISGDYIIYGPYVLDAKGNPMFDEIERNEEYEDKSIYVSDGKIVSSLDSSVYLFDLNQNLKWKKNTGAYINFVEIKGNKVFAVSFDEGKIFVFDFEGELIFSKCFENEITNICIADNYFLISLPNQAQFFKIVKNGSR